MSCSNPRCNYGKVPVDEGAGLARCPECQHDWNVEQEKKEVVASLIKRIASKEFKAEVKNQIREENAEYAKRLMSR